MKQKIILIISVVAGLVAAFLTGSYIAAQKQALEREKAAFDRRNRSIDVLLLVFDNSNNNNITEKTKQ